MKRRVHILVSTMALIFMLAGGIVIHNKASADGIPGTWQVNGKYSISTTELVTKCRLEGPDSSLKKKTRVYKITSKTKVRNMNGKVLKGNQRKKFLRRLNKKNATIQFRAKKGVVQIVYPV